MFEGIKFGLFDTKKEILLNIGIMDENIIPFDDEIYNRLKNYYFDGLPLSMHVRNCVPKAFSGRCDIRAQYLFFGVENAKLMFGYRKDLEYKIGNYADSWHCWVEDDEWVYDPTSLCKYKKDIYYRAYGVSETREVTNEEGFKEHIELIRSISIADYYPEGSRRYELLQSIPFMRYYAQNDKELAQELNDYLEIVQYDEGKLLQELKDFLHEDIQQLNVKKN